MTLPRIGPLRDVSAQTCTALRERCAVAGYTEEVLAEMEGIAPGMFGRDVRPLIHHVLRRRGAPGDTLARLFAYGDVLSASLARDLLGDLLVDALLDCGLLKHPADDQESICSPFELRPFAGLWLLADDPTGGGDAVMPPAGTTHHLARLMPATVSGRALDVGCGPGGLALVAAVRGASSAVGTDVNPRAVELATFSARLNGVGAEFLVGDLTAPVRGTQFDLVVSQPPFVIQPPDAATVTFLHGGPSGEELALRLLTEIPSVLAPGGRGLILMEAVVRPDEPLHSRMRPALADAPLDLLVLAAPGAPPPLQVIAYATLEVPDGGPRYPIAARRYLDQLDRLHVVDFQLGLIVLRARPAGDRGAHKLAATVPIASLARGDSVAVERLLSGIDLAALDDRALQQRAVRVAPNLRWVEERTGPDDTMPPLRSVRFGAGSFGTDFTLSDDRYAMALHLNRSTTVGQAVDTFAAAVEQQPDAVRRHVLGFVREALMRGLLSAAGPDAFD